MKNLLLVSLALAALLAGCSLPEAKGPARVCIPDSGFCHFPDRP